jgi:hypothetical protein
MDERFGELQRAYREYKVCDEHYEKLGKVEEVLVDASGQPMYIGIRMSLLKPEATLIPMELVRVNDKRRLIEAARPKYDIEHAPTLGENEEITPEFEDGVRSYFGLPDRWEAHGSTIHPPPDAGPLESPREEDRVDLEPGERKESRESPPASEPHLDSEPTPSERRLRRLRTPEG